jgi:site-specific recombinase XerD
MLACQPTRRQRGGGGLRAALKAAGLDETFGFHSLRHSYGTALAAQGVPMRTLQEWMGHKDVQTTQRYADYCPNPGERDVVEAAFATGTNPGTNLRSPQRTESN